MRHWLRIIGLVGLGLLIGLGLGLTLGWVVWPTEFTDANPTVLQENYRHDYALMIATTYALDRDLSAAQRRVDSLGEDGEALLFAYTLDMILRGENEGDIRRLVRLTSDLGLYSPAMEPYLTPPTEAHDAESAEP